MLSSLKITLDNKDRDITTNTSSVFHGFMMEKVEPDYATRLHQSGLNPYSQYISYEKDKTIWTINTLNEEAGRRIIDILADENLKEIFLTSKNKNYSILDKQLKKKTYQQLLEEAYFTEGSRYIPIRFLSPVAFKSEGRYVFFPDLKLVFKSLINRYDQFSTESSISDDEILGQIQENTEIIRYTLKSTFFYLEGIKVPAFYGQLTLKVNGPQMLVNLVNLIMSYGEYSGIGIKTALGMGAMVITQERNKSL